MVHSSSSKSVFKRARPVAIRDFPRGCGRHASMAVADSSESAASMAVADPSESANPFPQTIAFRNYTPSGILKGVSEKRDFPSHSRKQDSKSVSEKVAPANGMFVMNNRPLAANFGADVDCGHEGSSNSRQEVKEVLKLYHETLNKLLKEHEAKSQVRNRHIYQDAAEILKRDHKWVNTAKRLGSVPGVEIGDKFKFRAEFRVIGLHCQFERGIDYMEKDGRIVATSIVVSNRYANEMRSNGELIYSGEGGNPNVKSGQPMKDQVLELGNLALNNSMEQGTPVRVILTANSKRSKVSTLRGTPREKNLGTIYVYDGLYKVERLWQERGEFGKLVYKFQLKKMLGQPGPTRGFASKHKRLMSWRKGPLVNDISGGKERKPIAVVNEVDDQRPSPFTYVANMTDPLWNNQSMPSGCDCTQCSDSIDCSCKTKNGEKIPYDDGKHLIKRKPCVYECGCSCKCSDSCINRVSQLGIQFQLEVFKTRAKGWGVRSRAYIPSGSFVCEYIGEILPTKVAEQRVGSRDEYLFHLGANCGDCSFQKKRVRSPCKSQDSNFSVNDGGFTIDAAQCGNVGRFINHSCSPNLYVQKVLYDNHDSRMPHIMLFAKQIIPAFQELTYDYRYRLGEPHSTNWNFKAKQCMCQSTNCQGKFY